MHNLRDILCKQDELSMTSSTAQLPDAKSSRMLGSEITQAGVAVFDALQAEPELREARHRLAKVFGVLL